jgi:hypothetical protein
MEPNKNNEAEYLKEISPRLFDKKVKLNPGPPKGYFESFAERLNEKLPKQEETPLRKISVVNLRNLAIAATIAALVALIPFFAQDDNLNTLQEDNTYAALAALDLDADDISDYVDMELIIDETIEKDDSDTEYTTEFTESEIVTFLMNEGVSEDLIINEYTENDTL